MTDHIFENWLRRQEEDLRTFLEHTDTVSVTPFPQPGGACRNYVAEFRCRGLVLHPEQGVLEADRFAVAISFHDDHLRRLGPLSLVWLLDPPNAWHPNINFPGICLGHLRPGVGITDILYQVYSILTYQNASMTDYLNARAASWARDNRECFPIDRRPLKRRDFQLEVEEVGSL